MGLACKFPVLLCFFKSQLIAEIMIGGSTKVDVPSGYVGAAELLVGCCQVIIDC
jgi:hypothetical protein